MSTEEEVEGAQLAAISNAVVGVFRDSYGRGPSKAKTYLFDDYVLCVLEDILTSVERTLVDNGDEHQVRAMRLSFQEAEGDKFKAAVTEATGRPVIAHESQVTFHPAVGFEMFVLGDPA